MAALLLLRDPRFEQGLQLVEAEEEVLRLAVLGRRARELRAGGYQFLRVQRAPAIVALVAARVREVAVGALALDVAVGEEALRLRVVGRGHRALLDEAIPLEAEEDLLHGVAMVRRRGAREEVEVDVERA